MSKSRMLKETQAYVAVCFMLLEKRTISELVKQTGLCASTLYRLRSGEFTLAVRHGTILALGEAAGAKLTFKHGRAKMSLVA